MCCDTIVHRLVGSQKYLVELSGCEFPGLRPLRTSDGILRGESVSCLGFARVAVVRPAEIAVEHEDQGLGGAHALVDEPFIQKRKHLCEDRLRALQHLRHHLITKDGMQQDRDVNRHSLSVDESG